MNISDELAEELIRQLVKAASEKRLCVNRAKEENNQPAALYHERELLRLERSLMTLAGEWKSKTSIYRKEQRK